MKVLRLWPWHQNFPNNTLYLELHVMICESKMSTTYMINSAVRGNKDILEWTYWTRQG